MPPPRSRPPPPTSVKRSFVDFCMQSCLRPLLDWSLGCPSSRGGVCCTGSRTRDSRAAPSRWTAQSSQRHVRHKPDALKTCQADPVPRPNTSVSRPCLQQRIEHPEKKRVIRDSRELLLRALLRCKFNFMGAKRLYFRRQQGIQRKECPLRSLAQLRNTGVHNRDISNSINSRK